MGQMPCFLDVPEIMIADIFRICYRQISQPILCFCNQKQSRLPLPSCNKLKRSDSLVTMEKCRQSWLSSTLIVSMMQLPELSVLFLPEKELCFIFTLIHTNHLRTHIKLFLCGFYTNYTILRQFKWALLALSIHTKGLILLRSVQPRPEL